MTVTAEEHSVQPAAPCPWNRPHQPPVPGPAWARPRLAGHEAGLPSCPPWIILDARADPHRCGELRRGSKPGRGTPRTAGHGGAGGAARSQAAFLQVRWGTIGDGWRGSAYPSALPQRVPGSGQGSLLRQARPK